MSWQRENLGLYHHSTTAPFLDQDQQHPAPHSCQQLEVGAVLRQPCHSWVPPGPGYSAADAASCPQPLPDPGHRQQF